ncbi:DJ-1/PfpI family protein [Paenibacillus tuaregi]|uniref:DJ-1/PfpI family protein n=1 Tax=Paenibacillus tuaregi TaxID=1816681 RepID=UPI0008390F86|nr:DJ-1/PfpI family protein [Paenibacillus tuaregi]
MLKVQVVLFDGFDLLDAFAPYEVFCAASLYSKEPVNVELVTAEGPRSVASGINGLKIDASGTLSPDQGGIIIVPGASGDVEGDGPSSVPAILVKAMNTELTHLVGQALGHKDTLVATVCGGSLLLAMGGLLEGRPAVTNHLGMDFLGATGAVPVAARVVDDGNLVTGGGVTSGLDVALYLVERELGPRIAHAVEQLFEYERRGTVWRKVGAIPGAVKSTGDETDKTGSINIAVANNDPLRGASAQESVFDGDWDTTISTPVGKMHVKLSISTINGMIEGKATQGEETLQLINPAYQGSKLTWSLKITKPMRINLKFEVAALGDEMTGIVKAGLLPASKLIGKRVSSP